MARHSTTQQSTPLTDVPGKNYLLYGDNLDILRSHKIPNESVDLCYIDPPFNSKRNYFQIYNNIGTDGGDKAQAQAFMDTWEWGEEAEHGLAYILNFNNLNNGKLTPQTVALMRGLNEVLGHGDLFAYLVHMTLRIVEIHRVLKPNGSFYLHCDPTASHYLKLILDSVFCSSGQGGDYINEICWQRTSSHNRAKRWGPVHDTIFFYGKSKDFVWNRVLQNLDPAYRDSYYRMEDDKGRFSVDNLTGPGIRTGDSGSDWHGVSPTSKSRHWEPPPDRALPDWFIFPEGYAQRSVRERLDILDSQGLVYWPPKAGGMPRFKRYLLETSGAAIQDMITDLQPLSAKTSERLGYPTQKPEALLERIIAASSNEGDVVLDAYCGCGTTVAVAQRLKRRWIGIDITYQSISLILKRLKDQYPEQWAAVEASIQLDGVPRDIASAIALANRKDDKTRKEFEKWAVLTYSNNQARINDKKGADGGIDGIAYFMLDANSTGKAVFQVKSGGANRATIATLNSDRLRESAAIGILITMDATKPMRAEAASVGKFKHPMFNREDDCIQIVTIAEILEGKRISLPMGRVDLVKTAPAVGDADLQQSLI